jgi:hypothetical protein
LLPKE